MKINCGGWYPNPEHDNGVQAALPAGGDTVLCPCPYLKHNQS